MVRCSKCKAEFETYEGNFHRNSARVKGYDNQCRTCKSKLTKAISATRRDRNRVYNKVRYKDEKHKYDARKRAKLAYPDTFQCAVLNCDVSAEDLHHVDYRLALDVVPLCRRHHRLWHETVKG